MSQSSSNPPPNAVDITTLQVPQLSSLQQRLSSDLEHLSTSHARLRAAQTRFKDCIRSIQHGVQPHAPSPGASTTSTSSSARQLLIPLTTSLYVPGTLSSTTHVLVDVGTGFYVEKKTQDAIIFYEGKVEDLGRSMAEIERAVGGKSDTLRSVEDVLRQKVLAQQGAAQGGSAGAAGGGAGAGGGRG